MNPLKNAPEQKEKLEFRIEEKTYLSDQQFLLGHELKSLAGIPLDVKLFMQNRQPWVDNLIENNEEVDLARHGIEYFFVEKNFELTVNGTLFHWHQRYITGAQLRKLAKLSDDTEVFLKTVNNHIDRVIEDDDKVDLMEPGIEHFFTQVISKTVTLIVSGVPKIWNKKKISFREVVILAYGSYDDRPSMVYTVAYEDGPKQNPEGSMVKATEVFTKDRMIFHATATDKS
nr:multiubiquitin domain-containing protein [uncultured Mucilaginibacter sp.]